jgi:hypothetical protein
MHHPAFLAKERATTDIDQPASLLKSYTSRGVATSPAFLQPAAMSKAG